MFTSVGHVVAQVFNRSAQSIEFRATATSITSGAAKPVRGLTCKASPPDDLVVIPPGAMMEIGCGFSPLDEDYKGRGYNPAYRYLRIHQPGFSRAGRSLAAGATMEWSY